MAYDKKKPMSENEKKAKLTVLKDAHKQACDVMTQSLTPFKDPKSLKDNVKDMSDQAGYDFEKDSQSIKDPKHLGKVVGRQISFEQADSQADDSSVYDPNDLDSVNQQLEKLMKMKRK